MIVKCEKCGAAYNLDESMIKENGSNVRCSACRYVFKVYPPVGKRQAPVKTPLPVPRSSPRPRVPEITERGAFPEPGSEKKSTRPRKSREKKKYIPFKTKLIYFAAALIGFIALIVIPIEAYRPMKELFQLVENGKNLIAGTEAAFNASDLEKMNKFAKNTVIHTQNIGFFTDQNYYNYSSLAFNLIVMEGKLVSEEEALKQVTYLDVFEGGFDYYDLLDAFQYWKERFSSDPEILEIFRKYKQVLIKAKENARATGFGLSEIYLMIDSGVKEGFFKENIAYVLDSIPWQEYGTFCGLPYQVPLENEYWRGLALTGQEGYGTNPMSDPILPRFAEDEWGSWFSVWKTQKAGDYYNVFSIDFNARSVKRLMLYVGLAVAAVVIVLMIMVTLIARGLGNLVTRPITELTKGAGEVANGNYDYEVPVLKMDEFGELTLQFNQMTKGQKERLNLMDTLRRFLGDALAERAAEEGLMLGGQKADCTVMFTDFAGFSTITQKLTATETVEALNTYFGALIPIVQKYGGFADKYIGDAIVAMFGAPITLEDHAKRALLASIEMQRKMREINEMRREQGKPFFEMRIGLNSGDVIAGAIGCEEKLEYTAIGETTNLANRMESACPIGHVKMAKGTYLKVKTVFFPGVSIGDTEPVKVKGYNEPVESFSVYIDNRVIKKDMTSETIETFYVYNETDYRIRNSPSEITDQKFTSAAEFIN